MSESPNDSSSDSYSESELDEESSFSDEEVIEEGNVFWVFDLLHSF
jgi:hypothetical protein